MIDLSIKGQ